MGDVIEIVLPSGKFARIGPATGKELLTMMQLLADGKQDSIYTFLTIVCFIDDSPITYQELLDMDFRDAMKLRSSVTQFFEAPVR